MKMPTFLCIQTERDVVTYLLWILWLPRIETSYKTNNQTNYIRNCKGNSDCISFMFKCHYEHKYVNLLY